MLMHSKLEEVFQEAKAGHTYLSDLEKHGISEHWAAELEGDCDSFALWCRDKLKEHGIDSDLVYCKTEKGDGHLVLSVKGWVLDSRHKWVMRRDDLDYTWISIGKPGGSWREIIG
jgi:predicted transglutaminase-like cysteine proteinase